METRYKYSKLNDNQLAEGDSCEALIVLAQIDAHQGRFDRAIDKLNRVKRSLTPSYWRNNWTKIYDLWRDMYSEFSDIFYIRHDYQKSYAFSMLSSLYKDSINTVIRQSQSQKIQIEAEAEKQLAQLKQIEDKKRLSIQARNFSLIALVLCIVLLLSLYNRQRLENRKDQELFQNREQLLYSEKRKAEEQLSGYLDLLQEKIKMIDEFHTEIEQLKSLPFGSERLQTIERLEQLQQTTIITEDDWVQFKDLFEKVYRGFFGRLKEKYHKISIDLSAYHAGAYFISVSANATATPEVLKCIKY